MFWCAWRAILARHERFAFRFSRFPLVSPPRRRCRRHVGETSANRFKRRARIRSSVDPKRSRLAVDSGVPVAWIGVIAQPLRTAASALPLDSAEHVRHLPRIVASTGHDLRAQQIRFTFVLAAVLHEICAETDLRSLRDDLPGSAADDGPEHLTGDRAELKLLGFCRLQSPMAQDHVTEFVRHYARNLIVRPRRLQHAAVEKHRTTRQREGIDVPLVHHVERISERRLAEPRRHRSDEPRADALDQILGRSVVQHRKLLSHLRGRLPSELNILRRGKAVSVWLDSRLGRKRPADQKCRDREEPPMMPSSVASHTATLCKQGTTQNTSISQSFAATRC